MTDGSLIYHYTGLKGLMGIVETGALWATDIRYLNDTTESTYGRDRIGEHMASYLKETPESPFVLNLHWIWARLEWTLRGFVVCFSAGEERLSQWRGYGRLGYAIGFDRDRLETIGLDPLRSFTFMDLDYDDDSLKSEVYSVLDQVRDVSVLLPSGREPDQTHVTPQLSLAASELMQKMPRFKHHAFHEEREVRALHWQVNTDQIELRASDMGPTPYISFVVGSDDQSPIRDVIVGPTLHPDEARDGVDDLLARHKLSHVKARSSEIPLRW